MTTKPIKFAHAVFRTNGENFEKIVNWWKTFLQAEVRYGNDFICFLSYDDEHHRIAIINRGELGERDFKQPGFEKLTQTCMQNGVRGSDYEHISTVLKNAHDIVPL